MKTTIRPLLGAGLAALVCAAAASAFYGPPSRLRAGTATLAAEVNTGHRKVTIDGQINNSQVQATHLSMTQNSVYARGLYGITDDFTLRLLLGTARTSLGGMSFGNAPALGTVDLKGKFGFLGGIGAEYFLPPSSVVPDLNIGISAEYHRFSSGITGGSIDVNEGRFAVIGGRRIDRIMPYAGVFLGLMNGDWKGTSNAGFASSGGIKQDRCLGVLAGAEYAFTERVSARIEGQFVATTSVSLGVVYTMGGPSRVPAPVASPAPPPEPLVSPAAPPPPPAAAAPAMPADAEFARRDVRAAEDQVERGNELAALGKNAEAIPYYRRAVEFDPGNFRALYNLGTALYVTRDYAAAKNAYLDAVRVKPTDPQAFLFLGFSCFRLGDTDGAVRAWERVLELDPDNAVALNNLQALKR